jgi:hypothetical protein
VGRGRVANGYRRLQRAFGDPEPETTKKHKIRYGGKQYVVIAGQDRVMQSLIRFHISNVAVPVALDTELAQIIAKTFRFVLTPR